MRHQHRDLSITDFPTAYGQWIPDTSPAAIAAIICCSRSHRNVGRFRGANLVTNGASFRCRLVAIGVIWLFVSVHREKFRRCVGLSTAWLIGVFVQLGLGAWTIWSNKAARCRHHARRRRATMLGLGAVICAFCSRRIETPGFSDPSTKIGSGHRMKGADYQMPSFQASR